MPHIQYVLVTGATGFIGAHIVDELLRRGLRVRAAARSHEKAARMVEDRPQYKDRLEFVFVKDLMEPGSFDEAVKGVDAVVHAASPLHAVGITDNEKELVLPAINGVKSVLDAAKKEPSVKRIVFVSSFAAVADVAKGAAPGYTYTSADWNPMPYDEGKNDPTFAYRIGKTYAERAAWDCIHHDHPHFDLVTFCPPAVSGPVVHPVADLNLSNAVLWSITRTHGVRCLCRLRRAGSTRYTIAAPEHFSYQRAADIVRKELEWTREVVTKGKEGEPPPDAFYIDSEAAAKDLGVRYRKFRETVLDAFSQFRQIQLQER